ncbi:MAG: hypothetical protein EOM03_19280, partial [Clostridia bacterium]|nr:hypothetical protein [Clostridia bacterium]
MNEGFTFNIWLRHNIDEVVASVNRAEQAVNRAQDNISKNAAQSVSEVSKKAEQAAKQAEDSIKSLLDKIRNAPDLAAKIRSLPNVKARPSSRLAPVESMGKYLADLERPEVLSRQQREFISLTAEVGKFKAELASALVTLKGVYAEMTSGLNYIVKQKKALEDARAANENYNAQQHKEIIDLKLKRAEHERGLKTYYDIQIARQKVAAEADKLANFEYQEALRLNERNKAARDAIIENERLAISYKKLADEAAQYKAGPTRPSAGFVGPVRPVAGPLNRADLAIQQLETAHAKEMLLLLPKIRQETERIKAVNEGEGR